MKKASTIILVIFALSWLIKEVIYPVGTALIYSKKFMRLAHACDTAMEASWFYRQDSLITDKSEIVQMSVCHNYDKTRKVLLMSGLPESYLSWLGLKSLELYQRSPNEFVQQHRFVIK